MPEITAATLGAHPDERLLALPGGRRLAYAERGDAAARVVVLFFSGLFSVGTADSEIAFVTRSGAHYLAPTPTGMGRTSPRDPAVPYHLNLASDISALLASTHPDGIDGLYLAGGSYGTAMAQMLYGAPPAVFPYADAVRGMLLIAGFSPFSRHVGYARALEWQTWAAVGPPSRLPFRALQRAFRLAMAPGLRTVGGADKFLRGSIFGKMGAVERELMAAWLVKHGDSEDALVRRMAEGMVRSVGETWDGFMEVSDVLHSDWGFDPRELDGPPVLVVGGEEDDMGGGTNKWLVDNYRRAEGLTIPGGHISGLFCMDEMWDRLEEMVKAYERERENKVGV